MRRYFPDLQTFTQAAANADIVPVYRQLLADRLTPVYKNDWHFASALTPSH